jgi:hypothetical protein
LIQSGQDVPSSPTERWNAFEQGRLQHIGTDGRSGLAQTKRDTTG